MGLIYSKEFVLNTPLSRQECTQRLYNSIIPVYDSPLRRFPFRKLGNGDELVGGIYSYGFELSTMVLGNSNLNHAFVVGDVYSSGDGSIIKGKGRLSNMILILLSIPFVVYLFVAWISLIHGELIGFFYGLFILIPSLLVYVLLIPMRDFVHNRVKEILIKRLDCSIPDKK